MLGRPYLPPCRHSCLRGPELSCHRCRQWRPPEPCSLQHCMRVMAASCLFGFGSLIRHRRFRCFSVWPPRLPVGFALGLASSARRFSSACFLLGVLCFLLFLQLALFSRSFSRSFLLQALFLLGFQLLAALVRAFHAPAVRRVHAFPAQPLFLALDGNVRFAGVRLFLSPWRRWEAGRHHGSGWRRGSAGVGGAGGGAEPRGRARPAAEPLTTARLPPLAGRSSWSSSPHGQRRDQCGVHHNGQRHRAQAAGRRGGENWSRSS